MAFNSSSADGLGYRNHIFPSHFRLTSYPFPVFRVEVRGIVRSHSRDVLLVKRSNSDAYMAGAWEFPGGKLERHETPEDCVVRELFEETSIRAISPFIIDSCIFQRRNSVGEFTFISMHYLIEEYCGNVILSKEHKSFAWLDINEAMRMNLRKPCKQAVEKLLSIEQRIWGSRNAIIV